MYLNVVPIAYDDNVGEILPFENIGGLIHVVGTRKKID